MHSITKGLAGALLLASLAACGSGLSATGSGSGSGSGGTGGGGVTTGNSLVELGNGVGTSFKQGVLAVQTSNLSAGGSTDVTATLVDANNANALYTQSVTLTFTSNCVSAGTATMTSTVTTSNGTAIATYQAKGCSGKDTITATAAVGTSSLTATVVITVQPASIGTIQFVSATPSAISLQGVGGNTTSKVIFQVNDVNGNPVGDQTVDFTLSSNSNGVSISPKSAITDSSGQAATFVQAGTTHTSVNVTATVRNSGISQTTPNAIAVSTGIPVQSRFSLSLETHNLSQSFDHDGITDTVEVFAVDRYGNPASPGTNILFTTNSGVISGTCPGSTTPSTACGSCQTDTIGHCSVTWSSAGNRPDPANNSLEVIGHAHILAYTVGEEHYTDADADGVFDAGDLFTANTNDSFRGPNLPIGDDIGDPYIDLDDSGTYTTNEPFVDISNAPGGTRRSPDGKWYGAGCGGFSGTHTTVAASTGSVPCANKLTMIGLDACMVLSTDDVVLTTVGGATTIGHVAGSNTVQFTIVDTNGNFIGEGSTVAIVGINVSGVTLTLTPSQDSTTYTQGDAGCATPGVASTQTLTVTSTATTGVIGGAFYLLYTTKDSKLTEQTAQITIN